MQIIVDGLLVNYERSGKGKTVLLIHGWGDTSAGLLPLNKSLSSKFDVITPDLPGFGGSNAPKTDWNLSDFSDFLIKFLNKLGVNKLEAVIGHSNGGAIAIKLSLSTKVKIEKLILLSSAGIRSPASLKLKTIKIGTKIGKALTYPLPTAAKSKLRSKHYERIGSDMLVNENMTGTFKKIVGEDLLTQASNVTIPTLLIYGDQDKGTPPEYGMMYHQKIEGSTLEIINGAGHFAHLEETQKVVKLITDFIC